MTTYVNPKQLSPFKKRGTELYRAFTAGVRLLPDFIIIGGNRCGTGALYQYLCEHPSFAPSFHRELHFFERRFGKGLAWYRGNFPSVFYKYYITNIARRPFRTGEATTYYIFHPHAPRRIFELLPHVKLIALLRNPANRAYAQYHQKIRQGRETLPFEQAIEAEPTRLSGEREKMLADERYESLELRDHAYLARGIYVDQLAYWMTLFPKEQILVLRSEDLRSNPAAVVKEVLNFLELPAWEPTTHNNYGEASYPKMEPDLRKRLNEYFLPHNRRLYDFLGRDFAWT